MLTNIISRIYNCAREEDILTASVESIKQSLNCDRSIVYAFAQLTLGSIIAKSTLPALSSIKRMTIEDPGFEPDYIGKYQHGGVQSIDNIHEADISDRLVNIWVKIVVKANITVPIIGSQNELFGLLVVDRWFNYRHWQEPEIEFLKVF